MTENHFDQFFKDRLDQYTSPVNSEVLDKVFRERGKRKRRPPGLWWVLPLLMLIAGGGYLIYPRLKSQNKSLQSTTVVNKDSESASNEVNVEENKKDASNNTEKKVHNDPKKLANKNGLDINTTTKDQADGGVALPASTGNKEDRSNYRLSSPFLHRDNSLTNESNSKNKKRNSFQKDRQDAEKGLSIDPNKYDKASTYASTKRSFRLSLLDPTEFAWTDQLNTYKKSRENSLSRGSHFPFCFPDCNFPGCPSFSGPRRNDWYIEAFASIDFPSKKLENQSTKSGFIQAKDTTETMLTSFSAGFRISKNITNSWLLKTGLHYSRINERFDYRNENEKKFITIITIRTIIRAPGDTLVVSDTSFVEQTGTRVKRTYNKYRNIDIPVILSYEVRNPDFTVGVQGGLLFNIRSWYSGDMLDTSFVPMSETSRDPKSQFKSSMGVGIYAGVSFIKPISSAMDLFAEPWYRKYLQNHATQNAPFRQSISSWGLQLGVRYKLNAAGQRDY